MYLGDVEKILLALKTGGLWLVLAEIAFWAGLYVFFLIGKNKRKRNKRNTE
tara:strand:+ start:607 stop:759 length:153 start_codon:yes stop_codon:yes gene_type:complete